MNRSRIFFLSLASLAFMAVGLLAGPSFATDRGGTEFMTSQPAVYVFVADFYRTVDAVVLQAVLDVVSPGVTAHDLAYTVQNQPNSTWRFAAETYSRIDPHILA